MASVSVAEAKAHLSDLIRRGQAGEEIEITVRGKPAVRLVAVEPPRKRIDLESLRRLRESIPYQEVSGVDLIRAIRDEGF
jgi:prevent-host-death family protein